MSVPILLAAIVLGCGETPEDTAEEWLTGFRGAPGYGGIESASCSETTGDRVRCRVGGRNGRHGMCELEVVEGDVTGFSCPHASRSR